MPDCRVLPFFGAEVGWLDVREDDWAEPFIGKAFIVSRSAWVMWRFSNRY